MDRVTQERRRRLELWEKIDMVQRDGVAVDVETLRVHKGEQGIYRDQQTTAPLTPDGLGVTVSLLHTGSVYSDDLGDSSLIYHYPRTGRGRTDQNEIEATKHARRLGLPVFVLSPSGARGDRLVHLAWVDSWDDSARRLLLMQA